MRKMYNHDDLILCRFIGVNSMSRGDKQTTRYEINLETLLGVFAKQRKKTNLHLP